MLREGIHEVPYRIESAANLVLVDVQSVLDVVTLQFDVTLGRGVRLQDDINPSVLDVGDFV